MNPQQQTQPSIGLALSGSGNRSTFYIGFLEALAESGINIDYISACSGGSLVAAAFACGALEEFKREALSLNNEKLKKLIEKSSGKGGIYSLDKMEVFLQQFTRNKTFEEVRPLMSFVAVDIETGEQVDLCMGDIARAARISCTLPGVFEPVRWGNRLLVDGGLLCLVPVKALKQFPVDITIAVNMRGTKHIFTERQLTLKKVYNIFKKFLFIEEIEGWVSALLKNEEDENLENKPGIFSVLGKSLDLAIKANSEEEEELECDLLITPGLPLVKRKIFSKFQSHYESGRKTAMDNLPKIKKLIAEKMEEKKKEKVAV